MSNVSAQIGKGHLAGNVEATLTFGSRPDILAQGYELVDVVPVPGEFTQTEAAVTDYVNAVNSAGVRYNAVPAVFGGANSNTVIYSLSPAIGGPRVDPHWSAVGGGTPFPF